MNVPDPVNLFEPDEYTAINTKYFSAIRDAGKVEIDPSGWIDTFSDAVEMIPALTRKLSAGRYYMDEGNALGEIRGDLRMLLEAWDNRQIANKKFTVCPSVGNASFLTMAVLWRRGVRRIVFETPCYFAAVLQAEWLGFEVSMIPTYFRDGYQRQSNIESEHLKKTSALWVTQPRISLGFNQDMDALRQSAERLPSGAYLVIDEAMDQSFPSHASALHEEFPKQIIRFKGLGKPLGLNGCRVAFILHPGELRADLVDCLETFAGALDFHSLEMACALTSQLGHFSAMLNVSSQQVTRGRIAAIGIASGSNVSINPIENGYIGTAVVNLRRFAAPKVRRHHFLSQCQKRRMPVIIGPSMHFATEPPNEIVRLNFFGRQEHLVRGVAALVEIAGAST